MDDLPFGRFDMTDRVDMFGRVDMIGRIDPATPLRVGRIGPRPAANDNNQAAGRRRLPRPAGSLFRFMSRRPREPGPA